MMMRCVRMLIVAAFVMGAANGCRKPKGGAGSGDISGIRGSAVDGYPLGERGLYSTEAEGQFTPVYFDYDSSQVRASDRAAIEAVAGYLRQRAQSGLIVEGHCDERGSNEYNLALGERRALAVRAYLVGLGIDGGRIQTKSYGEEKPAAMGHDESAWSQNRRAEFVLVY
jgi:peptidoglycan-associated lipoprotein